MTNNTKYPPMLSVELRALLERVATEADHMLGFTYASNYDECRKAVDELRALLDKPDECRCKRYGKDNPHWPCPVHAEPAAKHQSVPPLIATLHENGELIADQATIAQQAKLIDLLKGKGQGQGEPVLFVCPDDLTNENFIGISGKFKRDTVHVQPLYAEQPAPVAVVMPDSLNPDEGYSVEAASWYNLALDDVARLNGVKP